MHTHDKLSDGNRSTALGTLGVALAAGSLAVACVAQDSHEELRAELKSDGACTVETGTYGDACTGKDCAVDLDFVIHCPGNGSANDLQLALNHKRVWASFRVQGQGPQAVRVKGKKAALIDPLPGRGFAGQAVDGTIYRYLDGPAYLQAKHGPWTQVEVEGLPATFDSSFGFRVQPDGAGGLHAAFRTGSDAGAYRFASYLEGAWTWIAMGAWDPNVFGEYVGKDAWDRTYSLIHTGDWDDGPQNLLHFSHWDQIPVGRSGEPGRVANPPRPVLGGDVPIATLRQMGEGLELLSIIDGAQWSEAALDDTNPLTGVCPNRYHSPDGVCPPCQSESVGIEPDAYQLARTSGGQLWAAWFVTEVTVNTEYTAVPAGSAWRCMGTPSADASGTLHLVELAAGGTALRSLALPFSNVGFHPSSKRDMAIAAYGDRVAVLFPSQHHGALEGELTMRLLVFDTGDIE